MRRNCSLVAELLLHVSILSACVAAAVAAAGRERDRKATNLGSVSKQSHTPSEKQLDEESIELVDEAKVDELLDDNERNLLIFFFDSSTKCPGCRTALKTLEDIDDDLEATGWIEVVKSSDRNLAKELGVQTFPAIIYFRRKNPILYDGDLENTDDILRWVRAHEDVVSIELNDESFEDKTDSASPPNGAIDWFVLFYNPKDEDCASVLSTWEATAHKLRGLVHCGHVDINDSDDVTERFKLEHKEDCPSFILFRRGKMYKYQDSARDVKSLTGFALHRYREQRGHRVPDPPTKLEEFYEELKEDIQDILKKHTEVVAAVGGVSAVIIFFVCVCVMYRRKRSDKGEKDS